MTRLEDKVDQVKDYSPNVILIELTNAFNNIGIWGTDSNIWDIYYPYFRVDEMPEQIDLCILTWQDPFGETWGHTRILKNPKSVWAQSPEADRIYNLIAQPNHVLSVPSNSD
jgi:hypothetical protein